MCVFPVQAHEMIQTVAGEKVNATMMCCMEARLGIMLVAHVFQRPIFGQYQSLLHIAALFHEKFCEAVASAGCDVSALPSMPSSWAAALQKVSQAKAKAKPKAKAKAAGGASSSACVELSGGGHGSHESTVAFFKRKGCEVNSRCVDSKSKAEYSVLSISKDVVKLTLLKDTNIIRNVDAAAFLLILV